MTRNKRIKFDPCYFSNTCLFFNEDTPENVRLNQMSDSYSNCESNSVSGDNQRSSFAP